MSQEVNNISAKIPSIRERSQQLILDAAEQIFAQKGYDGATVREIAETAGLPKSNVLYYYSTKLDIYQAVLEDVLESWMAAAESFDHYDEPVKALSGYISAKLALSFSRRNGSLVWANELRSGAPILQKFLNNRLKNWLEDREKKIQGWIDSRSIKPIKPRYLLYSIWAMTQHYADYYHQIKILNNNKDLNTAEIRQIDEMATTLILRGIGAIH